MKKQIFAAAIGAALSASGSANGEEGFFTQFRDPEDSHLDASAFLEKGGFIPLPIIITEPAVGGGLGLAAVFLKLPEPGSNNVPTRSIIGAAVTGNDSKAAFAGRFGSLLDGNLKYSAAVGIGSINLDFLSDRSAAGSVL